MVNYIKILQFILLTCASSIFMMGCSTNHDSFNEVADIAEGLGDYKFAKHLRNQSKYKTGYTPIMAKYVEERKIPGATKYIRPAWVQQKLDAESMKVKSGECSERLSHLIAGTDLADPDTKEASMNQFVFLRKAFHNAGSNKKWLGMKGSILTDEEYKKNKKTFATNVLLNETASKQLQDSFNKLIVEKDLFLNYQPADFNSPGKAIRKETDGLAMNKDMSDFWFARVWVAFYMYSDLLWSAADINLECARNNPPKS